METIDFINTPLQTLALGAAGVVIWEVGKTLVRIIQAAGEWGISWIDLQTYKIDIQIPDEPSTAKKGAESDAG